jgi:carbon-monoxide dehydrogenase medium subunit
VTEYLRPGDLGDARAALAEHGADATVTAGGQSLSLLLRQGLLDPAVLLDVGSVPSLAGVEVTPDRVTVGAVTTYSALESHTVSSSVPMLGEAVEVIADRQIRNLGTVGGAVAHADPSLDVVPPLLCLDATVHLGSVDGERAEPLSAFHDGFMTTTLAADELVEAVSFPNDTADWGSAYTSHSPVERGWSSAGVAARVRLGDDGDAVAEARCAAGALADTGVRLPTVEAALSGASTDADAVARAAAAVGDDIDPLDDTTGSTEYKTDLATVLVERTVARAVERARAGEGADARGASA